MFLKEDTKGYLYNFKIVNVSPDTRWGSIMYTYHTLFSVSSKKENNTYTLAKSW